MESMAHARCAKKIALADLALPILEERRPVIRSQVSQNIAGVFVGQVEDQLILSAPFEIGEDLACLSSG